METDNLNQNNATILKHQEMILLPPRLSYNLKYPLYKTLVSLTAQ